MKRILGLSALLLTASAQSFPTVGEDWILIATANDGTVYYWPVLKTKRGSGGALPMVWMVLDQRPVQATKRSNGPAAEYEMDQLSVDCAAQEIRTLGTFVYDATGNVIRSRTTPAGSFSPPPGPAGERLIDTVCAALKKADEVQPQR